MAIRVSRQDQVLRRLQGTLRGSYYLSLNRLFQLEFNGMITIEKITR